MVYNERVDFRLDDVIIMLVGCGGKDGEAATFEQGRDHTAPAKETTRGRTGQWRGICYT